MAEAPSITCPRCDKKFKGKPELIGKRIRCPGCQKPFVVPSPDAKIDEEKLKEVFEVEEDFEMTSDADPKQAIQIPAGRRFFEDDGPAEYGITHLDETPRCPNCANPLESAEAVVCLYCGYNTSTRTWGKLKKTLETTGTDRFMWLLPGLCCTLAIFLQMILCLYICLIMPGQMDETWRKYLGGETIKLWAVVLNLFMMWPLAIFAYWRLVKHPTPPEKDKE